MSFDTKFKQLRNIIKGTDKNSLIQKIMASLYECDNSELPEMTKKGLIPWLLLYTLRLAHIHAGTNNKLGIADHNTFAKICNKVIDLDAQYVLTVAEDPNCSHLSGMTRVLSHQQFWYQLELHQFVFSRQYYLFYNEDNDDIISVEFLKKYGFHLTEMIELLITLWISLKDTGNTINLYNYLKTTTYSKKSIENFISTISLTIDDTPKYLEENSKIKNNFLQFSERTPFYAKPALVVNKNTVGIYSKKVLELTIRDFIFEFIKSTSNDECISLLADRFEEYVGSLIEDAGLNHIKESDTSEIYNGKVTDFVVPLKNGTILIEAKSVRMKEIAYAYPTTKNIINEIKDNILKAIEQSIELANSITNGDKNDRISNYEDFYTVIVTYNIDALGQTETIWDEFVKETLEKYCNDNNLDSSLIKKGRVLILGIEVFEQFIEVINGKEDPIDTINSYIQGNAVPTTAKFDFGLHINNLPKTELTSKTKQFEELFNSILSKIKT